MKYTELKESIAEEEVDRNESPQYQDLPFFSRIAYYFNRSKQFDHFHRVVKPGRKLFPPIRDDNTIVNTKYHFLTFIPVFLFHQFKYFNSLFFLCLALTQFYPPLKIGLLFTYIGPTAFVLILALIGVLMDEIRTFLRDREVNSESYT